jgi:hypothetical protein
MRVFQRLQVKRSLHEQVNVQRLTFIAIWTALLSAPVIILFRLIALLSIKYPFWDEWEFVPIIHKYLSHTLTISDLWAQHNEHRIFFPRIIMLLLATLTHWNFRYEVMSSLLFALGSTVLILLVLRRTFSRLHLAYYALLTIPITWLFLSPGQWENWLWGWQLEWFLSVLGLVTVVWSLTAWPKRFNQSLGFPLAIAAAIITNYSLGNGMLVWVSGAIILLCRRATMRKVLVWCAAGAAAVGFYYINYHDPDPAGKLLLLKQPINYVQYFFGYLGGTLELGHLSTAIAFGILFLTLFLTSTIYIFMTARTKIAEIAPWLGLGAYGILSAGIAGIARLDLGVIQSVSSRYTTISVLFVISTFVISFYAFGKLKYDFTKYRQGLNVAGIGVVIVFGLLFGAAYMKGIHNMRELDDNLAGTENCIHSAMDATPNCLMKAYPNKSIVWERIVYLRSIQWGSF